MANPNLSIEECRAASLYYNILSLIATPYAIDLNLLKSMLLHLRNEPTNCMDEIDTKRKNTLIDALLDFIYHESDTKPTNDQL